MPRHSTRFCLSCGIRFQPQAGNVNRGGGTYCSRGCYFKSLKVPLLDRFFDCIGRKTESGCIPWTGTLCCGYAIIGLNGRNIRASHIAYELAYGPLPDGMDGLHKCDNPICVNPAHLFSGTHAQNMQGMRNKGRHAHGKRHGHAKITNENVLEIRERLAKGDESQTQIAERFGVTQTLVSQIGRRKIWSHV